jgi:hypothetical protein
MDSQDVSFIQEQMVLPSAMDEDIDTDQNQDTVLSPESSPVVSIPQDKAIISLDMIPLSPGLKIVPQGELTPFQLFTVVFSSEYNLNGVPPGMRPGHLGWLWTMLQSYWAHLRLGDYQKTKYPEPLDLYGYLGKCTTVYNRASPVGRKAILRTMRTRAHSHTQVRLGDMIVIYCYNARGRLTVNGGQIYQVRKCDPLSVVLDQIRKMPTGYGLLEGTVDCFKCPTLSPIGYQEVVTEVEFQTLLAAALMKDPQKPYTAVLQRYMQMTTINIPSMSLPGRSLVFTTSH